MKSSTRFVVTLPAILLFLICRAEPALAAEPLRFRVELDADVAQQPIDGRLFVFLSSGRNRPRPSEFDWARTDPFFGLEVRDFRPGTDRQIDDAADGYPDKLSKLPAGEYWVKALLDHDFYSPHPDLGVGNLYSGTQRMKLDPASSGTVELLLEHKVEPDAEGAPPPESKWLKEIALRSERLSQFHGREVLERATVALPPSYYDTEGPPPHRRYPVIYSIPGFGGSHRVVAQPLGFLRSGGSAPGPIHHEVARAYGQGPLAPGPGEEEFIYVLLSGQCKWGHHCYANSQTNGPRGDALVYELIPHIDRTFRTVAALTARFLTGHSSGGWSALWLQVSYPDFFGGAWSSSPDPVDFRDFQGLDVYADPPENAYHDNAGRRRPLARRGGRPWLWFDSFTRMDDCLGRGGQLRSFEAVFSPRGPDGLPQRLWDRQSGRIDPQVARAWQKYDIRLLLEQDWERLGPKLEGKLHVVVGDQDNFYLDGAVRRLAESLRTLGSDAEIEILPGQDHFSVATAELRRQFLRQMSDAFRGRHPGQGETSSKKSPARAARSSAGTTEWPGAGQEGFSDRP